MKNEKQKKDMMIALRALNGSVMQAEEFYGRGLITREEADKRIDNAKAITKFLLKEKEESKDGVQ
jgi:hypothetical protein